MGRTIKGISFSDEYMKEYIQLSKESNASQLICELLRDHYFDTYSMSDIKRDMTYIKSMLADIMQYLEVSKFE